MSIISDTDKRSARSILRNAPHVRPWPAPLISSAHPECDLCSWAFNPRLGGTDTPFVIKYANKNCHHAGIIQRGNTLLGMLENAA